MPLDLTPERGLLFRITHTDNLPWLLNNGLHSAGGGLADPGFVPIGLANLIAKRTARAVPVPPGGVLADYVPFYFTPKSPSGPPGLWLADRMIAPCAPVVRTRCDAAGVDNRAPRP
eukprot:gene23754-44328_t